MQDVWMACKAEDIQGYVDLNEWKNFSSAIKAVSGLTAKGTAPLLSADGTTLPEKARIPKRCAENFRHIINRLSTISDDAIARLPKVETNADLDRPPLSLHETISVVQEIISEKTPGSDAISAETYKHGGPDLWISRQRPSRGHGAKNKSLKTLRMQQSSISTSGKGTAESATTTEESHCSKSPE
ncbi:hypothetical protein SprV_0200835000 [Sparganum proliferum]